MGAELSAGPGVGANLNDGSSRRDARRRPMHKNPRLALARAGGAAAAAAPPLEHVQHGSEDDTALPPRHTRPATHSTRSTSLPRSRPGCRLDPGGRPGRWVRYHEHGFSFLAPSGFKPAPEQRRQRVAEDRLGPVPDARRPAAPEDERPAHAGVQLQAAVRHRPGDYQPDGLGFGQPVGEERAHGASARYRRRRRGGADRERELLDASAQRRGVQALVADGGARARASCSTSSS